MSLRASDILDRWLWRRGFTHAPSRRLLSGQIHLAAAGSALAMAVTLGGLWGWSFAAGAWLSTLNFWWLVKMAMKIMSGGRGVAQAIFGYYVRLGLLGAALYLLIVMAKAQVWAVLAGLTTVLATILWWGAARMMSSHSAKEA